MAEYSTVCKDVALFWFHNSTWPFFNVKVKNVAFDTSKIITNACFSMKDPFAKQKNTSNAKSFL